MVILHRDAGLNSGECSPTKGNDGSDEDYAAIYDCCGWPDTGYQFDDE